MAEEIGDINGSFRGIYAGDFFYIVSQGKIICYDREDGYKKAGELVLK